jgi:hypothetical protein
MIRLMLYISSRAMTSAGVEARLRDALGRAPHADEVELEVRDIAVDPVQAEHRDLVFTTPCVVITLADGDRRVVMGDLRAPDGLKAVLHIGEIQAT